MSKNRIFKEVEGGISFSLRFDKMLYERLRKYAFENRIAMAEIIRKTLKEKLDSLIG